MKVRGTTSFTVDSAAPISSGAVVAAMQEAVAAFARDHEEVLEANLRIDEPVADDVDIAVGLNIVFRSVSYAEVEESMNDLRDRLRAAVATAASGAVMAGHETELVPA